jgi:hypothetical protein
MHLARGKSSISQTETWVVLTCNCGDSGHVSDLVERFGSVLCNGSPFFPTTEHEQKKSCKSSEEAILLSTLKHNLSPIGGFPCKTIGIAFLLPQSLPFLFELPQAPATDQGKHVKSNYEGEFVTIAMLRFSPLQSMQHDGLTRDGES